MNADVVTNEYNIRVVLYYGWKCATLLIIHVDSLKQDKRVAFYYTILAKPCLKYT